MINIKPRRIVKRDGDNNTLPTLLATYMYTFVYTIPSKTNEKNPSQLNGGVSLFSVRLNYLTSLYSPPSKRTGSPTPITQVLSFAIRD